MEAEMIEAVVNSASAGNGNNELSLEPQLEPPLEPPLEPRNSVSVVVHLFEISDEYWKNILSEWLSIRDVLNFDTALNNRQHRAWYLAMLQADPAMLKGNPHVDISGMRWLAMRKIYLSIAKVGFPTGRQSTKPGKAMIVQEFGEYLEQGLGSRLIHLDMTTFGIAMSVKLIRGIARCHYIEYLNLGDERLKVHDNLFTTKNFTAKGALTRVTRMDISGSTILSDIGMSCISKGFPSLQELNLKGCENITDAGFRFLAQAQFSKQLTLLDFQQCPISNDGLMNLALSCPSLTTIKIGNLMNTITVPGLLAAFDMGFQAVNELWYLPFNDDNSMALITEGQPLARLTLMVLAEMSGLTEVGIRYLGQGFPNITSLSFSLCNMTDDLLEILIKESNFAPNLTTLRVRQNKHEGLTNAGLRFLKELPALKTLDFSYSKSPINNHGIIQLAIDCPNLESLDCAYLRPLNNLYYLKGLFGVGVFKTHMFR